jgi:cyclase
MTILMRNAIRRCLIGAILALKVTAGSQDTTTVTELSPSLLVFATSGGNVVASVGPAGALLVGTPSAASTLYIADVLDKRTKSAFRYVVIFPQDLAHTEGDAGWVSRGAYVAMQENALERLGGHAMGAPHPLPRRLLDLNVDRPRVAFSEVLTFDLNGEAIHIVHQKPGYSDADAIAHFHVGKLIYLGEVFPGDGYPDIDLHQGGNLNGLLETLKAWSGTPLHVVPARGKVATGADLKAFQDMILTVKARVQKMIDSGQTEDQVISAHPSADFDSEWGHGPVTPGAFVHTLYTSIKAH